MSEFIKPDNLNVVWASGGDRLFPGDTKYASGWGVEIPPRQYFNEIDYKQDQMLAHINQRGIAEWDTNTEYQAEKSYVQDTTGTIHRCILTHKGQNPELDLTNTYWEIAFANAGDFYTKTEADTIFITPSELSTYSYSKTETYTKTEVDGKTTVASAAQAQQQTSNTVLLTPLRLSEAFKGTNQTLNLTAGKQTLPGGLIMQFFTFASKANGEVITFPEPFPNAVLHIQLTDRTSSTTSQLSYYGVIGENASSFTLRSSSGASVDEGFVLAIGY